MHLPWVTVRGAIKTHLGTFIKSNQPRLSPQMGARACSSNHRRFTDKHEWVTKPANGIEATVGISEYAQDALGEVVFVQVPAIGARLGAGEECGSLESVKAASELYSPVAGTVTVKNTLLENNPALINTSCYDKGWLFKLNLTDPAEFDKLMDQKQYDEFLKSDTH